MMSSVLCVGLVCIDNILTLPQFPLEDSDQMCLAQHRSRGGNASNNCTILSELGIQCPEFFGVLPAHPVTDLEYIIQDFLENKVKIDLCPVAEDSHWSEATVILSKKTGSRTIIFNGHHNPELSLDQFVERINLSDYSWIHFEARGVVKQMLQYIQEQKSKLNVKVSVEIEKIDQGFENLLDLADLVFLSKDFATHEGGAKSADEAIEIFKDRLRKGASLICTWGDKGSAGFDGTTETFFQCAPYQPPHVVDTLGAGDTFTASVIATLIKRPMTSLEIAAKIASKIAGAKVGQLGYGNLRSIFEEEIKVVA